MSLTNRILVFALLLVVAFPAVALADAKSQIEARAKEWLDKFNAGDAAGVAAIYADAGRLLPPMQDEVDGKEKIQEFWQGAMAAGVKSAAFEGVEVHGAGDLATEVGRYVMKGADGQQLDHGKYIVLWKKQKGSWVILRDIWNSSAAPAAAAK
jgi:uncharacterized protein (TIGR02246 family)